MGKGRPLQLESKTLGVRQVTDTSLISGVPLIPKLAKRDRAPRYFWIFGNWISQLQYFSFLLRHDMSESTSPGVGGKEHLCSMLQSSQVNGSQAGITWDKHCRLWWHTWLVPHFSLLTISTKWAPMATAGRASQLKWRHGQTCLCLSNHTRRQEQSIRCPGALFTKGSITSSQGRVET